ncbi:MarR family winged helix-turn-helix transcriptional regulator [Oerskovia flava]|uniref:MarR family winged helix-turn-helix transcriptional regulator n=1 Tax=Oerskovia flava TaxID=2986422 RepID=UPI00223F73F8|nr:MarR family transcriptional regulator [Oerskovia sp. JB1-3-2]
MTARESLDATLRDTLGQIELALAQLVRRAERSVQSAHGSGAPGPLDRAAYLLLQELGVHGPQNVQGLAARMGLDPSTVTRQVAALEAAGHVHRTRDPQDRRAVVAEPTPVGLQALAAHRAARAEHYGDVLAQWSRLDRALLAEMLERLNDDLDAHHGAARPGAA